MGDAKLGAVNLVKPLGGGLLRCIELNSGEKAEIPQPIDDGHGGVNAETTEEPLPAANPETVASG